MKPLRMFMWMLFLTGIAYPLCVTLISYVAMRHKAQGSLLTFEGRVIGSSLIAQKFESSQYFWPRPSAIDYQPLPSGGSNLGPTSRELKKEVEMRRSRYTSKQVPSELLFASASGIDPHISPEAAYFQSSRVANARHIEREIVNSLIRKHTKKRRFGLLGVKHVNVLELNRALDLEEKGHAK